MSNSPLDASERRKAVPTSSDLYAPFAAPEALPAMPPSGFASATPIRVVYEYSFTEAFYLDCFRHYRRGAAGRRVFALLEWALAALFAVLSIPAFWFALVRAGQFPPFLLSLSIALYPVLKPKLVYGLARHRFHSHPSRNGTFRVTLEDAGFDAHSEADQVKSGWAAFTNAQFFADGILLFRGPEFFHWLPDAALHAGTRDDAEYLIQQHIADCKVVT